MTPHVPSDPGYYCRDPQIGWIRFAEYIDMMLFYTKNPCECRIVSDPIEENTFYDDIRKRTA